MPCALRYVKQLYGPHTRKCLQTLQMENVHDRTAVEIFFLACRSDVTMYNKPVIHYSSERMKRFIETITGATMADVGIRSEAYCIGGVEGTIANHAQPEIEADIIVC